MREQYWDLFTTTKITQFYYQFYAVRAARGKTIVSAVCLFASGSLALTFPSLVSGKLKVLWAALIFAAQLISILQPSFPFEKQAAAASYLQRELAELTAQMEIFWVCHNYEGTEAEEAQYDTDFRKAWVEYRTQADAIEYRFVTADSFPPNKRLNKRAEKEAEIFLGGFKMKPIKTPANQPAEKPRPLSPHNNTYVPPVTLKIPAPPLPKAKQK